MSAVTAKPRRTRREVYRRESAAAFASIALRLELADDQEFGVAFARVLEGADTQQLLGLSHVLRKIASTNKPLAPPVLATTPEVVSPAAPIALDPGQMRVPDWNGHPLANRLLGEVPTAQLEELVANIAAAHRQGFKAWDHIHKAAALLIGQRRAETS